MAAKEVIVTAMRLAASAPAEHVAAPVPPWDGANLAELLALDACGDDCFRSRCGDANSQNRAYGGGILGQAVSAAAATVPPGRVFTALQFLFLQGTLHDSAITFDVERLQDGKRFSSRHVRGEQGGSRRVFDAQLTFAVPMPAPSHEAPVDVAGFATEDPERLPALADLPSAWSDELARSCGYRFWTKESIDLRIPGPPAGMRLALPAPRFRYWIRVRHRLPEDANVHAAAFAYLSDWWLNYSSVGGHVARLLDAGESLYVASLNHAIWVHRSLRADEWLHVDSRGPSADAGRGLAIASVHDRTGRLVATATQECLMAPREVDALKETPGRSQVSLTPSGGLTRSGRSGGPQ